MIVTCPGCASKYRVRDEAVSPGGTELKCPSCGAVFVAHPPRHSEEEIAGAVEKVTRLKDIAEARVKDLETIRAQLERRVQEVDSRSAQLEAQILVLRSELQSASSDAAARVQPLEAEVLRLREENKHLRDERARAAHRAQGAADAELKVLQLTEELARSRVTSNPEIQRLNDELHAAQKTTGRLTTELELATQQGNQLRAELARAQEQARSTATTAPSSSTVQGLVAAIGPMMWGLEQAIEYLQPFSQSEPALAAHVKQLQLLQAVLRRLKDG